MSPLPTSFLMFLCLILVSVISAEHNDLGLSPGVQGSDQHRELHFSKSSKRSSKDWMYSPDSQRQYNSKYGQHNDASNFHFRGHKRGQYHHQHEGITSMNFESWGLNRIKKALQRERSSSSTSSSSSKSWRSSSSKSSVSSSQSAKEVNDASNNIQEQDTIHINTLEATRIEKENP